MDTETIARVVVVAFLLTEMFLLYTPYEGVFEAVASIGLIAAVITGFALHPRKDVFYVKTVTHARSRTGHAVKERDFVAVRVELARLWILFIPTMLAVALIVVSAARGKLGAYSIVQRFLPGVLPYGVLQFSYYLPLAVILLLCVWIGERWVLRNAEACYARSVTVNAGLVGYQFMGEHGEYYGGYGMHFGFRCPPELRSIVFYDPRKWERNRIAMGLMFHRIELLGRGVTDLDAGTAKQHAVIAAAQPAPSEAA